MIDLILKDIQDVYVRENFFRLNNILKSQILLNGNFKLFDIKINKAEPKFKVAHGLAFIPIDVLTTNIEGDFRFYFRFQEFDKDFIYLTTSGPVQIRFLAGKLDDNAGQVQTNNFPLVPP